MKTRTSIKTHAFTLSEMMVAIALGSSVLGTVMTSSIALQKSFNSVDNYLATHMQQVRIVDYLGRDVRRGLSVTTSTDKQSVTVRLPNYIVQAGDADATSANIGTPRQPTMAISNGALNINYGATSTTAPSTVVYRIIAASIVRVQDGVVTTIASSTDNIIPETTNIILANTEYTTTAVTFKPISAASRNGTLVCSTAYLRNRRRTL